MSNSASNLSKRVIANNLPTTDVYFIDHIKLQNLQDITLSSTIPNKSTIMYNSSTNRFENAQRNVVEDFDDTANSFSHGDLLTYDGGTGTFVGKPLQINGGVMVD